MVPNQILSHAKKNQTKVLDVDREFAKYLNSKGIKFPVHKTIQKQENEIIFPSVCLVMKIEHHNVFILQNKLLKNILIYYYHRILKIPIVLIKDFDRFMANKKQSIMVKNIFVNIAYNASLAQKYQNIT